MQKAEDAIFEALAFNGVLTALLPLAVFKTEKWNPVLKRGGISPLEKAENITTVQDLREYINDPAVVAFLTKILPLSGVFTTPGMAMQDLEESLWKRYKVLAETVESATMMHDVDKVQVISSTESRQWSEIASHLLQAINQATLAWSKEIKAIL